MLNKILMSKGIKLAFLTAIISGLAVFFNKFALSNNINAYQFTSLKNILVGLVLTTIILTPIVFRKLKKISKNNWIKLFAIGLVGGSIPFLLFFKGLSMTSAVNAGFIHKTLFIWVTILAVIFLKERVTKLQYIALGVLLTGTILLGGISEIRFGTAELMVLLATLLWAVENIIAKQVLKNIDPKIVAWARMFFGSIILLGFVAVTSGVESMFTLNFSQWGWMFISVGLLLAYVVTWYHALKFEKVSVVSSVLVIAAPITALLNSIYRGVAIDHNKISGILLSFLAVAVFIYLSRKIEVVSVKKDGRTI